MKATTPTTPTWAEVSLKALKANFKALQKLAKGSEVLPVVKANAYGHGLVPVAKALVQGGARFLAVAFVQEGVALRKAGVKSPILVLTPTLKPEIPLLLKNHLIPQVSSVEGARELSRAAKKLKIKNLSVHVKIDTGMARVGIQAAQALREIEAIQRVPGIQVRGVYTHLATADWTDPKYAWGQITQFRQALEKLQRKGIVPSTHVANSAALITYYPQSKGTWVRPGIALYGVYPHPSMKSRVHLTPVMQVKTRVLHTKTLEKGESVSYGRTYTAKGHIRVATLAMGYADGLLRSLSNKGSFLIRGKKVPIIGTVCMDMAMVDVSKVSGVKTGDIATFFGRDGRAFLPVEEQAAKAGTISYELLCAVGARVQRIYV
ncbi:MAG TPA: alanine racemase [bacterium]|nr:alanine racemase [bacterium]